MAEEQEWANLLAEVFDKLTAKHAAITYDFDNLEMNGVVERNGKKQPTGTVSLTGKLTITTKQVWENMKSKLPANFLISLTNGSVKISENKKPAIEFSTKNDDRVVNIISMPVKISGKKSAIKRLADARDLAKTLKKEGITLDIQRHGNLVLRLGEKAKPKFSKIITFSGNIEITDLKALRSLEKGV